MISKFSISMIKIPFVFLLGCVALQAAPVFIGTSPGKTSAGQGIYLADFDPATGKLSEPTLAVAFKNPGFLAQHPTLPVLYACGAPSQPLPGDSSVVAAFAIDAENHLRFIGESSAGGKGACHVTVDATGRTVAVANYGDGTLSTIRLNDAGVPSTVASVIAHTGSGPAKPRQNGPHAHAVYFDLANKHLFVPDLGLDQVFVYPFDAASSKLGEPLPSLTTAPGAGPRHLAFSSNESHAYVINELNNTVLTTTYKDGKWSVIDAVATLPADFSAISTTSEIEVHPNGRFVYASNRGHDSLTVYQRDLQTGALKFLQHAPCGGKTPRHFKIDPSGRWLLCAHQNSDTISVLVLDPATGLLGEATSTVKVPCPACVLFAR